jgi:hypothetical protein
MKKSKIPYNSLHLTLLVAILVLLYLSYSNPWATGNMSIIEQNTYATDINHFGIVFILIVIVAFMAFFYTLITRRLFWSGMAQLITGALALGISQYILFKIKDKEVSLFGLDPLKIISANHKIGLTLFIIVGILIIITGIIYLIESFFKHR